MPADHFTLGWLSGGLRKRSFGIIVLLFGLAATVPGVLARRRAGLLMIPACQLILGHTTPVFPRPIAVHPIPTRHLAALVQRAVPVLRYLEKAIHPRWQTPLGTDRAAGGRGRPDLERRPGFHSDPHEQLRPRS